MRRKEKRCIKMVEQNISGVKLEQLRQNAVKKHKILRKLLPVCLILFIGLTLVKNRFLFVSISEYGFGCIRAEHPFVYSR